MQSEPPRIDAVMFCHEYAHIGVWDRLGRSKAQRLEEEDRRRKNAYGTYFFSTLFLPFLLRSPPERDIRFINLVNPMYAASVSQFEPKGVAGVAASSSTSVTQLESERSLRSILFARHFQRVLDALVNPPVPPTSQDSTQVPITSKKQSNIKFVTACPGFGLEESIAPFLGATRGEAGVVQSRFGRFLYVNLLQRSSLVGRRTHVHRLVDTISSGLYSSSSRSFQQRRLRLHCTRYAFLTITKSPSLQPSLFLPLSLNSRLPPRARAPSPSRAKNPNQS